MPLAERRGVLASLRHCGPKALFQFGNRHNDLRLSRLDQSDLRRSEQKLRCSRRAKHLIARYTKHVMKAVYLARFVKNGITFLLCGFIFALDLPGTYAQDQLPDLVRRIKPSSVAIETFDARREKLSRGSGFFVDKDR